MPEIKLKHVVSCNSQDKQYPVDNLLDPDPRRRFKCFPGEKQAVVVIQFEKSSQIHSVDIGNESSAFVELLVGRSSDTQDEYQVLLPASAFMNPKESRDGQNCNRVRMFTTAELSKNVTSEKWDKLKIVCTQPFNKELAYGLAFIRLLDPPSKDDVPVPAPQTLGSFKLREGPEQKLNTGSLFSQRKSIEKPESKTDVLNKNGSITNKPSTEPKVSFPKHTKPAEEKVETKTTRDASEIAPKRLKMDTPSSEAKKKSPEPQKPSTSRQPRKQIRSVPFEKLMSNVSFVLSGYENPYRGQLRQKAVEMGAKYKPDWGPGCTHLICAFSNTPKFNKVKGKGNIVTKEWILDCHKQKKRISWRKYALDKKDKELSDSDDELIAEDTANAGQRKDKEKETQKQLEKEPDSSERDDPDFDPFNEPTDNENSDESGDTDDELQRVKEGKQKKKVEKHTKIKPDAPPAPASSSKQLESPKKLEIGPDGLPILPDFFNQMRFMLYGDFSASERKQLNRYICSFGGKVEQYMNKHVTHVITHNQWDKNFDQAREENENLWFVKAEWVLECGRKDALVDMSPYVILKS